MTLTIITGPQGSGKSFTAEALKLRHELFNHSCIIRENYKRKHISAKDIPWVFAEEISKPNPPMHLILIISNDEKSITEAKERIKELREKNAKVRLIDITV